MRCCTLGSQVLRTRRCLLGLGVTRCLTDQSQPAGSIAALTSREPTQALLYLSGESCGSDHVREMLLILQLDDLGTSQNFVKRGGEISKSGRAPGTQQEKDRHSDRPNSGGIEFVGGHRVQFGRTRTRNSGLR